VVQVYAKGSLAGFRRNNLKPREKRTVEIALPSAADDVRIGGLTASR
jgi:hypothetical protein